MKQRGIQPDMPPLRPHKAVILYAALFQDLGQHTVVTERVYVIARFSHNAELFKKVALSVLCMAVTVTVSAAIETVNATTVRVDTLDDLEAALKDASIETIIVKKCITLENGTELDGQTTGTKNKTIQVEKPFLPENGKVTIGGTGNSGMENVRSTA